MHFPFQDDVLGRTATLDGLRRSKGLLISALLDALDQAGSLGMRPNALPLPDHPIIGLARENLEGLLQGIARRLSSLETTLDVMLHAEDKNPSFPQEGDLSRAFADDMRMEIGLARLHLNLSGYSINIAALASAVETMAELAGDFIATIHAWRTRATEFMTKIANLIGMRVRRVSSGYERSGSGSFDTENGQGQLRNQKERS